MSTIAHLSPYGDKLCPIKLSKLPKGMEFPSPRGDKLCRMNEFKKHGAYRVSVPSRG